MATAASFPPFQQGGGELSVLRKMVHSLQVELDRREGELRKLRQVVPWCSACRSAPAQVCSTVCWHLSVCRECYDKLGAGGKAFPCPLCRAETDSTTCFTIYLP